MQLQIEPVEIGSEKFYTVTQFAALTSHSDQSIYNLIKRGNTIRKLRAIKVANRLLIPISELCTFPFTPIGSGAKEKPYYYNEA